MKLNIKKFFLFLACSTINNYIFSAEVASAPGDVVPTRIANVSSSATSAAATAAEKEFPQTINAIHAQLSKVPEDPLFYPTSNSDLLSAQPFLRVIRRPIIPYAQLKETLDVFQALMQREQESPKNWVEGKQEPTAYIQKKLVPAGAHLAAFGDIHGSAQSLIRSLNYFVNNNVLNDDFTIIDPQLYFVFLGDYIDRGQFSIETWYIVMLLKIANPTQVFLLAGNHEIGHVAPTNWRADIISRYEESDGFNLISQCENIFDHLPKALYLGTCNSTGTRDYLLFAHAGIDLYANVTPFLLSDESVDYCAQSKLPEGPLGAILNEILSTYFPKKVCLRYQRSLVGYTWFYFTLEDTPFLVDRENHYCLGRPLVQRWLDKTNAPGVCVHGIIRAHQHSHEFADNLEQGLGHYAIMDNLVHTIISAPAAGGLYLPYDSFLLLRTATDFEHWTGTHIARKVGFSRKHILNFEEQFCAWLEPFAQEDGVSLDDANASAYVRNKFKQKDVREKFNEFVKKLGRPLFTTTPSLLLDGIAWQEQEIMLTPAPTRDSDFMGESCAGSSSATTKSCDRP